MLKVFSKIFLFILLTITLIILAYKVWFYFAAKNIPSEIGKSVAARPLPEIGEPIHPYLNEPQRSSMHGGAYNRDLNSFAGPLGINTVAVHRVFSSLVGVAPNLSFDNEGRLITVSIQLGKIELHLLDPDTLESLAVHELPAKASFSDNSGGGYFHLDRQGRVMLAPADKTIQILEVIENNGGLSWRVAHSYDVSQLPEGTNIHDVIPDYQGNLWFVTNTGLMGYLQTDTSELFTYQMPDQDELIQNSFGVDEQGLYVVSTNALYQFKIDPVSKLPMSTWREPYDKAPFQKPGMLSHGSGTSPTLIGEDLVAIVDDAIPNAQILVYQRQQSISGPRLVCKIPIFEADKSATENSLMVYGNAMVVQNDYGHDYNGNALQTSPGIARVDVREDRSGCDLSWYNKQFLSQSLPRLSTATGLLYFYTFQKPNPEKKMGGWYLTAVDFDNGEELWSRLIGAGTGSMLDSLSSVTAPVVLGPNGAAYAGIRTGVIMAKDTINEEN